MASTEAKAGVREERRAGRAEREGKREAVGTGM